MENQDSKEFDGRKNWNNDAKIEELMGEFFKKHDIDYRLILRNFPMYVRRVTMKRFLAHYELYARTIGLPGDIVELGVYRGTSFIQWANFLECREIGNRTKRVIGFDNFYGFRKLDPQDGPKDELEKKVEGGFDSRAMLTQVEDLIEIFDQDRFIPEKKRTLIVTGDIEETVPKYVKDHPGLRISLLHFDADMYSPTKVGLEHLWDKVVPGGVVIFDEYGIETWAGESQAVDEFFQKRGIKPELLNFDWQATPGAFVIKE